MKNITQQNKYSEFPQLYHDHMNLLLQCFVICSSCAKRCLEEGNCETAASCYDCADICALTIKVHSGDSKYCDSIFKVCADTCVSCADTCAEQDSEYCKQCSDICYKCAEACNK
jgi:hypothetical protein